MGNRAAQEDAGSSCSALYARTEIFCDNLWYIFSVLFSLFTNAKFISFC